MTDEKYYEIAIYNKNGIINYAKVSENDYDNVCI